MRAKDYFKHINEGENIMQTLYEHCIEKQCGLHLQWHSEMNGLLTPETITTGSGKKVWWICEKGHEWQAVLSNRVKGNGCPICANKRIASGVNDFATLNPRLAAQWHPSNNGNLSPDKFASGSEKKVWWMCEKGHEWQASFASRSGGSGCPVCSNKLVVAGINDFATLAPELASQWHPTNNGGLIPQSFSIHSGKKVWWICEKGHEWQAIIAGRSKGSGCPICSNRKIVAGINDLATLNTELASQWHPTNNGGLIPQIFSVHSGKKVWWICEKGHEWQATIASRSSGNGCPACSNKKIIPGVNDLASINPRLAAQWHTTNNVELVPQNFSIHSGKKVWWICEKGHEWQATIASRVSGCGCPYCAGVRAYPGESDLSTLRPELAKQWHPHKNGALTPSEISKGSGKKVWWTCEKQHEWQAIVASRARGNNCPYCSGRAVILGETDLATTAPALLAQWHPTKNGDLYPQEIKAKSGMKVWWQCEKGHEWQATPLKRSQGRGCPYCSERKIIPTQNSLYATHPDLAAQWHPTKNENLTSIEVGARSGKKVWWICGKGHEWKAKVSARSNGTGCPVCAGKIVKKGYNDLASIDPQVAIEWHPTKNANLMPADVTANSNRKVWWQCVRGHEWYSAINNRRNSMGCAKCNAELHTSFAEQAIYFYIKQVFEAHNRYRFKGREIDVYIPSQSIGIEHDGYFHKNESTQASDKRKDALLRENGIYLFRIKTGDSCFVDINKRTICYNDRRAYLESLEWAIGQLFIFLKQIVGRDLPIEIDIDRDRINIYQQYIQLEKERSLAIIAPDAEKYWHPQKNGSLLPHHFSAGSGKTIWCQCELGHEWKQKAFTFAKGYRCPYCTGRKLFKGFNDLSTVDPLLAKEWHPIKNGALRPDDVKQFSNRKVWWQCENGHEWQNTISNRSYGKQCPVCRGQKVLPGYNDLATKKPHLISEWHPEKNGALEPCHVTVRSGQKVWWKCAKGHEWQARVADRSFGYGCPFCCGRRAVRGENDLASQDLVLAAEWHTDRNGDLKPHDVKPYSHNKVWWICKHGHEWQATVASRTAGNQCPSCYQEKRNIKNAMQHAAFIEKTKIPRGEGSA